MMASRKSEAGVSRPKQRPPKKGGMMQLALAAAVIVVVIVALFLIVGGGRKKPSAPRSRVASAGEGAARKSRKSPARPARTATSSRAGEREKRREERLQRREESRASGGSRTSRTSTGGYSRGGATRSSTDPTQLRAILTDGTGSRFALVGERRFKSGDEVEGRRIVEVSGDAVKVEYRQNTYTVRVGEKLY
jgi:hypothetical protein